MLLVRGPVGGEGMERKSYLSDDFSLGARLLLRYLFYWSYLLLVVFDMFNEGRTAYLPSYCDMVLMHRLPFGTLTLA